LTSVVFDISAITELLVKEDQPPKLKELLGHILACSLAYMKMQTLTVQRMSVASPTQNIIFKRYLELAQSSIKLSKLNELLQTNRDNPSVVEPLLRVLMLIDI
jgi:hypothetical protein